MFIALLICSDESCTEELEAWGTLGELDAMACDCGCALQVISVSEVDFEEIEPAVGYAALPLAA